MCMLSLMTGTLFAQVSSSANASATIVSEVGITELQGNNLITFAAAEHDLKVISTAGIGLLTNTKTVEILSFKIISNENDFSITLPSQYYFAKEYGEPGYIPAQLFITPSLKNNDQSFSLSTVFKKSDFQVPGNYSSSPLEIIVNYN